MLIFQYGSNLSSKRLNSEQRLRGDARVVGMASTVDAWRFGFPVWGGINGCAAAGILPGGTEAVWGVIYDIPESLVRRDGERGRPTLDAIEDEGRDYDRGPIEVCLTDGRMPNQVVHTYHPRAPRDDLVTEWHYVSHILEGAAEHGLPTAYRDRLVQCILANNPALSSRLG